MKKITIILLLLTSHILVAQNSHADNMSKNKESHIDPYRNGHLYKYFDPKQSDFSDQYLKLRTKRVSKIGIEKANQLIDYQFDKDSLFNTGNFQQNGIIGLSYRRIRIHISETKKTENNLRFIIVGKSNVKRNVCDFKGTIDFFKIYEIEEEFEIPGQAIIFAKYELYEDSTQNHAGVFRGIFECAVIIDHQNKKIKLNNILGGDGYFNRTYVGTWKSYSSKFMKKCIWGDHRLPFTLILIKEMER